MLIASASSPQWLPIVLAPMTLAGWLLLGAWWFRAAEKPGPLRRRVRRWRFDVRYGLAQGRRLRQAVEIAAEFSEAENARTTPPADEHVLWVSLWMVEIYLSRHVDGLVRGLNDLGWNPNAPLSGTTSPVDWLRSARSRGGPSSTTLGSYRPRGTTVPVLSTAGDVPETFALISAKLMQLGPGVTALIATFELEEDQRSCLERSLREPAVARAEAAGRKSERIYYPEQVKTERVRSERKRVRADATAWVQRYLPGAFCAEGGELPTWDLITSDNAPLVTGSAEGPGWRAALGLDVVERWAVGDTPEDLVFAMPVSLVPSDPRPSFVGRRRPLLDAVHPHALKSFHSVVGRLEQAYAPILSVWGAARAVDLYDAALARTRDQPVPGRPTYRSTRSQLEILRKTTLPAASDLVTLEALADLLLRDETHRAWFKLHSADPELIRDPRRPPGAIVSLVSWLTGRLAEEASGARRRAEAGSDALRAYGETLVAVSTLRLQRAVFWLSVVVTLATCVGLWKAFHDQPSATRPASQEVRRVSTTSPGR